MPLMFAWLLKHPAVLVSFGLVALVGVREAQDFFEDRAFRSEITRLQQEVRTEVQGNSVLQLKVLTHEASIEKLESTIREMNARLDAMNARTRQIESAANLRVARALRAGEEQAKELRAETTRVPPGDKGMNDWMNELSERLGS